MAGLIRFGVSIEEDLLVDFGRYLHAKGYANRSIVSTLHVHLADSLTATRGVRHGSLVVNAAVGPAHGHRAT